MKSDPDRIDTKFITNQVIRNVTNLHKSLKARSLANFKLNFPKAKQLIKIKKRKYTRLKYKQ